nr:hypothetical protein GCM10017611_16180 [Rhodococcus wratislaviensis]
MLVAFSVSPMGGDSDSVGAAVAAAVRVVRESGLSNETTSMFTTVEGEWDEVMAVVKRATDVLLDSFRGSVWFSKRISGRVEAISCERRSRRWSAT